jgi:Spy/CpxP family protein refolding chaperone
MRERLFQELNLTPEQRLKMEELEKRMEGQSGSKAWRATMDAISQILTPEQMKKFEQKAAGRDRRMANEQIKVLPPAERERFLKKLDEQIRQRARRFAPNQPR